MSTQGWARRVVSALASVSLTSVSLIVVVGAWTASPSSGAASPHLTMNSVVFPGTTLGTFSTVSSAVLFNENSTDTIDLNTDVSFFGPGADDYVLSPGNCPGDGVSMIVLQTAQACNPEVD